MKKKLCAFVLAMAMILPGVALLTACGTKKKESQENTLVINNVYQSAYGDVMLDIANLKDYLDEKIIEGSYDGGQTWSQIWRGGISKTLEGEPTFVGTILSCYVDNDTVKFGTGDGETDLKVGDKLEIALRFGETDDFLASDATEAVEYTILDVGEETYFVTKSDIPTDEGYAFISDTYNTDAEPTFFKIMQGTKNGDNEIVMSEVDATDLLNYEYKFLTYEEAFTKVGNNDQQNDSINTYTDFLPTSGWRNYNVTTGITKADMQGHIISYEIESFGSTTEEGGATTEYRTVITYTGSAILIREKQTATTANTPDRFVFLTISATSQDFPIE